MTQGIRIDLVGLRFGRLSVLSSAGVTPDGKARWSCVCDCGGMRAVKGQYLRNGRTQSCGCIRKERIGALRRSHAHSSSPIYGVWSAMRTRCSNPKAEAFSRYGAIGIRVCDRWSSFANFLADMGERPPGTILDRKNPFGDYAPDNCRWATPEQQRHNTRGRLAIAILNRSGAFEGGYTAIDTGG